MPSEQREPDYWLYLEPYVHVSVTPEEVLFYNALNGKRFEIKRSSPAGRITDKLLLPENGYVCGLQEEELRDPDIHRWIGKLKRHFMGDLLKPGWSGGKPANFLPEPYFKSHLSKEMLSNPDIRESIDFNDYIRELVIYLNNTPSGSEDPFHEAVKQFVFPGSTLETQMSIRWPSLEPFIRVVSSYRISQIQVSGSDIRQYPELFDLSEILAGAHIPAQYHLLAAQFEPALAEKLLKHRKNKLSVHFTFPFAGSDFDEIMKALDQSGILPATYVCFTITSREELDLAREIIRITQLRNTFLNPFFNKKNFDFFRQIVFLTRADIRSSRPSQHQVFSRKAINESNFGIFTLLPDESIWSNLNETSVGRIGTTSLEDCILKEMTEGTSWLRTRQTVSPCSQCLYWFLCPPVSPYELATGRFNFCDIFES